MNHRFLAMAAVIASASFIAAGQAQPSTAKSAAKSATAKSYTPPKTPWGDPDIQGNGPAQFNIPQQKPVPNAQAPAVVPAPSRVEAGEVVTINPPSYWVEGGKRTDLLPYMVIDPPDGRMPALTEQARNIVKAERGGLGPGNHFPDKLDSWEDFDFYSRCITRGFPSTMLYTVYNYGNDITQSPGYVAIRAEMVHEQRVIPLDGREKPGKAYRSYMGSSRGHWEGNTLVVETTNLNSQSGYGGGRYTDASKVTEHFTRTAADQLNYEATFNDPAVWTKPFTIRYAFKLDAEYKVYEYACHEGNYMMLGALTAARQLEKEGKDTRVLRGPAGGTPPGGGNQ